MNKNILFVGEENEKELFKFLQKKGYNLKTKNNSQLNFIDKFEDFDFIFFKTSSEIIKKIKKIFIQNEIKNSQKDKSLAAAEKVHILKILTENKWNILRSAKILKIDRVTLYNKIKKYSLRTFQN
ncbi:MAG: helix-turn-helix domain-containing protein [Ignavibacteriaceae bacterium]